MVSGMTPDNLKDNWSVFEGNLEKLEQFAADLEAYEIKYEYIDENTLAIKDNLLARRFAKNLWEKTYASNDGE